MGNATKFSGLVKFLLRMGLSHLWQLMLQNSENKRLTNLQNNNWLIIEIVFNSISMKILQKVCLMSVKWIKSTYQFIAYQYFVMKFLKLWISLKFFEVLWTPFWPFTSFSVKRHIEHS